MPNLYQWSAASYKDITGDGLENGSLDQPNVLTGVSLSYKNQVSLAQNAIGLLWNLNLGPTDFQYARILADQGTTALPVMLELTTDLNNVVKTTPFTVPLLANLPFELWGSASYANYTIDFAGGTLSKINQLRVKNLNATTANVFIWLFN